MVLTEMSLSKKHFEDLAERIRWMKTLEDATVEDTLRLLQQEVADFCNHYGPNFDRDHFMAACDRPWGKNQ